MPGHPASLLTTLPVNASSEINSIVRTVHEKKYSTYRETSTNHKPFPYHATRLPTELSEQTDRTGTPSACPRQNIALLLILLYLLLYNAHQASRNKYIALGSLGAHHIHLVPVHPQQKYRQNTDRFFHLK